MYILAILLIVLLWFWWWRQRRRLETSSVSKIEVIIPPRPSVTPTPVTPIAPAEAVASEPMLVAAPVAMAEPEMVVVSAPPEPAPSPASPQVDNLDIIEGIGPKIATVLQAAGITTFAQLAVTDVSHLQHIVRSAGLRMVHVETWPEQASLAANGQWEELQARRGQLKAGRPA